MRPQSPVRTISVFQRFLWWCAGAQPGILKDFPTDWNKYSSLGATVLATALLAMLSGCYAASLMVGNRWLAYSLGIVWGATIFNLDRLSVSTITKAAEQSHAAALHNLLKAIPRVLLAIMIAITISSPLQVKLFEREINQELEVERTKPIADLNDVIAKKEGELEALRTAIQSANQRADQAQQELFAELSGSGGSRRYGVGQIYEERRKEYEQARAEAAKAQEALQPQIIQVTAQLAELKSRRHSRLESQFAATFFTRANALSLLAQRDSRIASVRYLIILLFVMLETSPVLVMLLSSTGPYEQARASKRKRDTKDVLLSDKEADRKGEIARKIRNAVLDTLDKGTLKDVK